MLTHVLLGHLWGLHNRNGLPFLRKPALASRQAFSLWMTAGKRACCASTTDLSMYFTTSSPGRRSKPSNIKTNTRVDFARLLQHAHSGLVCFESLISCLRLVERNPAEKHILVNLVGIDEIRRLPSWPESVIRKGYGISPDQCPKKLFHAVRSCAHRAQYRS